MTKGYANLAELDKKREEEEDVRLMYVAATRARDHLIVSLYRNSRGKNSPGARIEEFMEGADHLWEPFDPPAVVERPSPTSPAAMELPTRTLPQRDSSGWTREIRYTLSGPARSQPPRPVSRRKRRTNRTFPTNPGGAVARGQALAVPSTRCCRSSICKREMASKTSRRPRPRPRACPAERKTLPGSCAERSAAPIVKRALDSGRWWRETPVAGPVGDGIVEGFIDLLFKEEDGFVIVDYKTDALGSDEEIERAMARYRLQGGGYALALSRATGATVKEVSFLFLEPSREVTVKDLSIAVTDAENAALALFAGAAAQ